jgi:lysylphosphatidylglycerol synthetase-like protein (DUF2156 family)
MQVGSSLHELQDNYAFLRASYVFVVFSMVSTAILTLISQSRTTLSCTLRTKQDTDSTQVSVASVLGVVVLIFVGIFVYNMFKAISHASSEQKARRELASAKLDKSV